MMNKFNRSIVVACTIILNLTTCEPRPDNTFINIPRGVLKTDELIRNITPDDASTQWLGFHQTKTLKTEHLTYIIGGKPNPLELCNFSIIAPKDGFAPEMYSGYYYISYLKE